MGGPVLDSDGGKPFKRKTAESLESSRRAGARSSGFDDPAADIELPAARRSSIRASRSVLRFAGFVMAAAAVAGAAGYLAGGVRLSTEPAPAPPAAPAGPAIALPVEQTSNRNSGRPAEQPAAINAATEGPRGAAGETAVVAPAPPPSPSRALPPDRQASEIAPKMKLGADLMAAGDIVAARTVFERVAEAGEAAGAFALAETYDPAVLGAMPLRGGIAPDAELARRWYQKAKDLGSKAASERIARLAGQ
jgi:hypothetical protein